MPTLVLPPWYRYRRVVMRITRSVVVSCSVLVLVSLLTLAGSPAQRATGLADEPARAKLRVALFALADAHTMQEVIRAMWREARPEVELDFVPWDRYKTDPPADLDVFEYDAIFLDYLADKGLVAKLSADELKDRDDFMDFALDASKVGDSYFGVPRIACTPVIFYRKGDAEIAGVKSLAGLFKIIGKRADDGIRPEENKWLLIDLSGGTTCSCFYLDAVQDVRGKYSPNPDLPTGGMLDPQAVSNLKMLTQMAGKNQARFSDSKTKYTRRPEWFGMGFGRAFVGWTERLSAIPVEKHKGISFRPLPLAESNAVNLLFVDILSVSPKLKGERRKLAVEFANFAASKKVVIATFLVRNARTKSPQYLLPVRKSVMADKHFLREAPLYSVLADIERSDPRPFRIGRGSRKWFEDNREAIQKAITD
jgi:thiamine pyridinylase